jgi:hypothetical protein
LTGRTQKKTAQPDCYRDCLRTFGNEFEWIAFIDADELIVPRRGDIKTLLASAGDAAAVVFNWAMFGSSGHAVRSPGLMIETFKRRAKSDFFDSRPTKQIVRPRAVIKVLLCDFPVDGRSCTPAGRPVVWGRNEFRTARAEHSVAQVNHYFTKDRAEWERKILRGYRSVPLAQGPRRAKGNWTKYDRNEILDTSALRFAPAVRAIMQRIGMEAGAADQRAA